VVVNEARRSFHISRWFETMMEENGRTTTNGNHDHSSGHPPRLLLPRDIKLSIEEPMNDHRIEFIQETGEELLSTYVLRLFSLSLFSSSYSILSSSYCRPFLSSFFSFNFFVLVLFFFQSLIFLFLSHGQLKEGEFPTTIRESSETLWGSSYRKTEENEKGSCGPCNRNSNCC
jgi:hypothetical protein